MHRLVSLALMGALAIALLAVAFPAHASARTVRVFAMGPKLDLAWMESRRTFRDKMFALMDARERGPGKPPVQAGADDAASHLLGPADPARPVETARDLVVWPEDLGLMAALTGERGGPARDGPSFEFAVASLLATYARENAYYSERFPDTAQRNPPVRPLFLAITDTFGRVVLETFAEMADRYDVYLQVGANMARDWKIVCRDRAAFDSAEPPRLPGGVKCDEENPDRVERLRDPGEPQRDYAYEATTDRVANMALVFDPDGRLISKQLKSYTTPAEALGGLDLVQGDVSGLGAVETPVGVLGFVTSKDAWMPDVTTKLDQRHVELLVQPEFFLNDVICKHNCPSGGAGPPAPSTPGQWATDTMGASGYNDVLRHPSIQTLVVPQLVGNIYNFSADSQQHIVRKPRATRPGRTGLAGQPPAPGFTAMTPFVVADPLELPIAERRRRLMDAGDRLNPGSSEPCPDQAHPGPCENGHVEGVLWQEIEVGRRPPRRSFRGRRARTRLSRARAVRPSRNPQRNIAAARRGDRVVLVFEERRGGRDQVLLVQSRNGGATWSRAIRPTGRPPRSAAEWWPSVALGTRGRLTVAWVDDSTGVFRAYYSRSTDGGRTFGPPSPLDASPPPETLQWRPMLAQGPGDVVHAVWIDERTTQPEEGTPQAGVYYTRIRAGAAEPGRRLDTGEPVVLARKMDNSWAPSIAVRGHRVLVAWLDFLRYDWDVFARLSSDGGERFADQVPVNNTLEEDEPPSMGPPLGSSYDAHEALNDSPQAVLSSRAGLVAWTDFRKRPTGETKPNPYYDIYVAAVGGRENFQVDPYGERQVSTFSPAACALPRDDLLVAFQDASRGVNTIRIARMEGGTRRGRARLVDDAPRGGGNAWRPRLACWRGSVLAAWEDERDGPAQVYAARARTARLR